MRHGEQTLTFLYTVHPTGEQTVFQDSADKCSLCFPGLAYKLAASLVNGIRINVHAIIVFVLVLELRVNIAFVRLK